MCRHLLTGYRNYLAFIDQWASIILKEIMWTENRMVRRIATISKVPVAPGLLKEKKFKFQRKIQELVTMYKIWKEWIFNFDQTLLSYIIVGNTIFEFSGVQSVPVKGKEKGKQITGTLRIAAAGKFFSIQLIYIGKTQHYHTKGIPFPDRFDLYTQKTIGAMKPWLSGTLVTSSFPTLK